MELSEYFELSQLLDKKLNSEDESPLTKYMNSSAFKNIDRNKRLDLAYKKKLSFKGPEETLLKIEKDLSYLDNKDTMQESLLVQQLSDSSYDENISLRFNLNLLVYYFITDYKLKITVPHEITARDAIIKALLEFEKQNYRELPLDIDVENYELLLPLEDSIYPDRDFEIPNSTKIREINSRVFCVVEKQEASKTTFGSFSDLLKRIQVNPDSKLIRFIYRNISMVIRVDCGFTLHQILPTLMRRFYISDTDHELITFHILVKENGSECELDSGLTFSQIPYQEFRLHRKALADDPYG